MKRNFYHFLILISSILVILSCVKREWYNPFDPNCPKDYYTPTNVKIVQEGNSIKLTWSEDVTNISGFKVTKQVDAGAVIDLPSLDKGANLFSDASLEAGKVHEYSILAYAGNNKSEKISLKITPVFAPAVSTPVASTITSTSMVLSNAIESDGGLAVTARGVCWGVTQTPTISDNKTTDGTGNGTFSSAITGLSPGTVYYIRAYATNGQGTSYSNVLSITTNAILSSITTSVVSSIGSTSATCGGTISSDGGAAVTARGVCWNTAGNPTLADNKTTDGTGTGSYTSSITGLTPGTTYYIRAYSVNSIGTTFGNISPFTTLAVLPMLSTGSLTALTLTTASCAATITNDGGSAITMKGVCWSTNPDPTTADSKTIDGTGIGSFVSSIAGLTPEVTYYVRPYAVNSIGTAYGTAASIKTLASAPSLTTVAPLMLTSTTATCGGNISSDGGLAVTARGVCWSTSHNPTLADAKTSDGTGAGSFVSSISGLTQGITYYIRAFATNSKGTTYGNEVTIIASLQASITTTDPTSILTTSVQSGGNVISDGGTPVTARGLCWSTSQNPTIANQHTSDGSGTGSFTSHITGLTPNTLYYIRSFATNTAGTVYGKQISITTSFGEVTDVDGNVYQTVKIGNQIWMTENFKATRLNDGTLISNVTDPNAWNMSTLPAHCFYNNDAAKYKNNYGAFYNGYTVATAKLAPAGWHIPTASEWEILSNNSGGFERLMEAGNAHWSAPAIGNNFTGFTALPAGTRNNDGTFVSIGTAGKWWTCEVLNDNVLYCSILGLTQVDYRYSAAINAGLSVRLIQGTVDLPVVNTVEPPGDIMLTSATVGGSVSNVAGPAVTSRGVCWAQRQGPFPTIADNKTVDGSGIGSYKSAMTGLTPGTTYICCAYATNSNGTSYGTVAYIFTTQKDEKVYNPGLSYGTVSDVDGNSYKTIAIGSQTWFAENLKTSRLNDGTPIPAVTDNTTWMNETSYAYCYYKNDASIKNLYGPLYNWNTVNTGKVCPIGWHVPANYEWVILTNQLGINNVGGLLKEMGIVHWNWIDSNVDATNASGFTALPGGIRYDSGFYDIRHRGYWWSSTSYNTDLSYSFMMQSWDGSATRDNKVKRSGLSIRCVKD